MKCPRCGVVVDDVVPKCRGCGFTVQDLDRVLGQPPAKEGCVIDEAGMLTLDERVSLTQRLQALNAELDGEMLVVTLPNARGVTPAQLAFWLFNRWQVGGPQHAGLLVLVTRDERRIECEVGYAWEAAIGDDESGDVLDREVVPRLREGRFAEGLLAGLEALAAPLRTLKEQGQTVPAGGMA